MDCGIAGKWDERALLEPDGETDDRRQRDEPQHARKYGRSGGEVAKAKPSVRCFVTTGVSGARGLTSAFAASASTRVSTSGGFGKKKGTVTGPSPELSTIERQTIERPTT